MGPYRLGLLSPKNGTTPIGSVSGEWDYTGWFCLRRIGLYRLCLYLRRMGLYRLGLWKEWDHTDWVSVSGEWDYTDWVPLSGNWAVIYRLGPTEQASYPRTETKSSFGNAVSKNWTVHNVRKSITVLMHHRHELSNLVIS